MKKLYKAKHLKYINEEEHKFVQIASIADHLRWLEGRPGCKFEAEFLTHSNCRTEVGLKARLAQLKK